MHTATGDLTTHAPAVGQGLWFLGQLMTVRATGRETDGRLAAIEILAPRGTGAPPHVHRREDEWFYVLDGVVTVRVGDTVRHCEPGSLVDMPRGIPARLRCGGVRVRAAPGRRPAGRLRGVLRGACGFHDHRDAATGRVAPSRA